MSPQRLLLLECTGPGHGKHVLYWLHVSWSRQGVVFVFGGSRQDVYSMIPEGYAEESESKLLSTPLQSWAKTCICSTQEPFPETSVVL